MTIVYFLPLWFSDTKSGIFKLAVRLRTSGASRNRDWWAFFLVVVVVHLSFFGILKSFGVTLVPMVCIRTVLWQLFWRTFWRIFLTFFLTDFFDKYFDELANFLTNFFTNFFTNLFTNFGRFFWPIIFYPLRALGSEYLRSCLVKKDTFNHILSLSC